MPSEKEPITDQELVSKIKARGTAFLLLDFEAPPMVEDVIFPQLRKAEEAIHALFQRNGFTVFRSDVDCHFVGGTSRARVLFELEAEKLPSIIKRQGPPIWEAEHLSRFLSSHPKPLSGPYIQEGRAFVEEFRKYAGAKDLLTNEISSLSLGKHLNKEVQREHNIYAGLELAQIKDHGFRTFMARYLEARFRMC
jgi:tRNA nucleotidyltransferase (CCA-adding enzyme)